MIITKLDQYFKNQLMQQLCDPGKRVIGVHLVCGCDARNAVVL